MSSINGPVFSFVNASYPGGGPKGESSARLSLPIPPPPSPSCSASQLRGTLTAAGISGPFSVEYVQFTNVSPRACHMEGYPGFDLRDGSGRSIVDASRGCSWAPAERCPTLPDYVHLPAYNGVAFFGFLWQSTPQPGQTCPLSVSALVTPPNAFDHLALPVHIAVCGEPLRLGVGTMQYAI